MPTRLEGSSLTMENIKVECRCSANKEGTNKKGVKRTLWINRLATVTKKDGVPRSVHFFVENKVVWAKQLGIVRFLVTYEEIAQWKRVQFLPVRSLEGE